jgi:hypothetical protein
MISMQRELGKEGRVGSIEGAAATWLVGTAVRGWGVAG